MHQSQSACLLPMPTESGRHIPCARRSYNLLEKAIPVHVKTKQPTFPRLTAPLQDAGDVACGPGLTGRSAGGCNTRDAAGHGGSQTSMGATAAWMGATRRHGREGRDVDREPPGTHCSCSQVGKGEASNMQHSKHSA